MSSTRKYRVRIFFGVKGQLRAFYWVTLGVDGSIYLGSSAAKDFNTGFCGSANIAAGKKFSIDMMTGRKLDDEEKSGHTSFHESGVINLSSRTSGFKNRIMSKEISEYKEAFPLVGILPMHPSKYPISNKQLTEKDIVFDTTLYMNTPFGIMMYAKNNNYKDPNIIVDQSKWERTLLLKKPLGNLELGLFIYSNRKTFKYWPQLEVHALATSTEVDRKLIFPVFFST